MYGKSKNALDVLSQKKAIIKQKILTWTISSELKLGRESKNKDFMAESVIC